ncbi:MAG: ubiquinone/menaquinone biosynthesis C-methylase UbiE [Pirellulaceae bacterium]|jgi:ubiquinone/menaquinone biosynthesis C-methylase UbiE
MAVAERLSNTSWIPPWIKYQHFARYEWVQQYCRGKNVIDAACGTGYGTDMVATSATSATGIDCSNEAIAEARELYGKSMAQYLVGDITSLPFPNETFDVYISFETIEHINDDSKYLSEAQRVLKKGGLFICSTPNREITNPRTDINDAPFNPHHVREYTSEELQSLLSEQFASTNWYGQTFYPASWQYWLDATAGIHPKFAVRCHQIRKLATAFFDKQRFHVPQPTSSDGATPEFYIAVSRK